jgi:transcriptional regulator with XRE-family HTH domain
MLNMIGIDNILSVNDETADKLCKLVADRVRERRLEMNFTQMGMAQKAGVNVSTYRRFESTGEIAFLNLVKIATALDMTDDIHHLFSQRKYNSIDEVINADKIKSRKRGKKNE